MPRWPVECRSEPVSKSLSHPSLILLFRSHLEKGLTELYGRRKAQRDQIRTLRSEKEELQNKLLKQALEGLSGGPGSASSLADLERKNTVLKQELEEAKSYKSTQNNCILELNGKLLAVQQHLQIAEDRLKTPLTGDAASAEVANLHKQVGEKSSRIKELEASLALERKLAKEKDVTMQKLADQLAVSSQLEGPVFSKAHMAEIQAEREKAAEAEARLEEALKVKRVYEAEVAELEAAKEELDERMLAQSDELRKTRADLEWAENEKGELEEDLLEIMRESGKSAMDAFQEQKDKIAQLSQDLAAAQELLDNVQHELMDDANERDKLQAKHDVLRGKLTDVTKKLASETKQNKAQQNRIGALESDVKSLEEELRSVKRKAEQTNGSSPKLQELQEENDRLARASKKATRQVEELKREVKDLQAQLEASKKDESAAEQKLVILNNKHRIDLLKVENEKKESDRQVNVLNYDQAKLKERIKAQALGIDELQEKIEQVEFQRDDLAARMVKNHETNSKLEILPPEKKTLSTELEAVKKSAASLKEQVSALNDGLNKQKEYSKSLEDLVKTLKEDQAMDNSNGTPVIKASNGVVSTKQPAPAPASSSLNGVPFAKQPPATPAPSTPAVARAPSVASSTASKRTADSTRDIAKYVAKQDMSEDDWKNMAKGVRKVYFKGGHFCKACL